MAKIKLGFIRRALIVFLATVLILPGFLGFNLDSFKIAAGDGSSLDTPIIITTPAELDNIRNGLNRHYKLGNDIDLTAYITSRTDWDTSGWEPIGTQPNPFTGSLDGDDNVITGLWIDRSTENAGLFGYTENATIKNLGVEISSNGIKGGGYAGGLVGMQLAIWGESNIITNCYATGDVTATVRYAGGLVGMQQASGSSSTASITDCYATGNVTATGSSSYAGGLVGYQYALDSGTASITNCYATGDVTVLSNDGRAGGLVGIQDADNSSTNSITDCYATGNVTATGSGSYVGGLVGYQYYVQTIGAINIITNCYATGDVTATGSSSHAGGLVGRQNASGGDHNIITNCYAIGNVTATSNAGGLVGNQHASNPGPNSTIACFFDSDTTGLSAGIGLASPGTGSNNVTGKTTTEMKTKSTFTAAGWDFTGSAGDPPVWFMVDGATYPMLFWQIAESGEGSTTNPYIIRTPQQLDNVRLQLDKHFKLGKNIDLTTYLALGGAGHNYGAGWEPIGTTVSTNPFNGSLDGDGYVITGLWINRPGTDYVGLFGYTVNAIFKNLGVETASNGIIGEVFVGGLVGVQEADAGTASITNCYVTGDVMVTGTDNYAGGLVGYQYTFSGGSNSITNCYATGDVTATVGYAGGLVGRQFASNGGSNSITNCLATGSITASSNAGGLVGMQYAVSGSNSTTACFFDKETTGLSVGIGATDPGTGSNDVTGKTTAEMKAIETFTTELTGAGKTPWDFTGSVGSPPVWYIVEGEDYPRLTEGSGTPSNPYIIYTPEQLNAVRFNLDKHFKLGNDIDLTDYIASRTDWGTLGWEPIGTVFTPFTGSLDGEGYVITGLWINRSTDDVGLFSCAKNATIKNLGAILASDGIKGNTRVGGLVGLQYADYDISSISNCYVIGSVTATQTSDGGIAGGLVGYLSAYFDTASITDCYATGDVTATRYVGGLVGYQFADNWQAVISVTNCYATGNVTATGTEGKAGGLMGSQMASYGGSSSITNCYATGDVMATGTNSCVGGLVGYQEAYGNGTSNSAITNCYATGNVTATDANSCAGGLVGEQYANDGTNTIASCYATGNVVATGSAGGLVGVQDVYNTSTSCITDSYATGNVMATGTDSSAGGLVGVQAAIQSSANFLANCYAAGDVMATGSAGGLVGLQDAYTYSVNTISNCYASGDVSATSNAGGLVGWQEANIGGANSISNSYRYNRALVTVNGIPLTMDNYSYGIHGGTVSATQLLTKSTYTGNNWLFNDSTPTAGPWYWDDSDLVYQFPKLNMGDESFPFLFRIINVGNNNTVTYAGSDLDVSALLFTLDPYAGTPTYTQEFGGSGEGFFDGTTGILTVDKTGTFIIALTTANVPYHRQAEEVTAVLTVTVGTGALVSSLTVTEITIDTITVSATLESSPATGQSIEYGINTTNTPPASWQESPIFTGLTPGTDYYVFARSAENILYSAGTPLSSGPHKTLLPLRTLTYNGNGNTGGTVPPSATYTSGSVVVVSGNTGNLVKTGYKFIGWSTDPYSTVAHYPVNFAFPITSSMTLYAVWEALPVTYTVTYNGNGNTSGTAPTDNNSPYNAGSTVTVMGQGTLLRTGYTFLGWANSASATSPTYGTTFVINSNTTLYAVWQLIPVTTYTITYNGNGSTGGLVPVDSTAYTSGSSVTVRANTGNLVRTGYTFKGWATTSGATTPTYAVNGSTVTPATFNISANTTLYAVWEANPQPVTYTVTYNGNGNTSGTAPVDNNSPYNAGSTVTVMGQGTLIRTGYTFLGWASSSSAASPTYGATFTINSNTTLYAVWKENVVEPTTYTVTYNGNDYTGGTAPIDNNSPYNAGSKVTVAGQGNLVRGSHTFKGWATSPSATTAQYEANDTFDINSNTVLYAVWSKNSGSWSGNSGTWALVNLMLAIIGILLTVETLAIVFIKKKEKRYLWLVIEAIAAIVGVVVFFLTQNMSNPIALVDWRTALHLILASVGLMTMILATKKFHRNKPRKALQNKR